MTLQANRLLVCYGSQTGNAEFLAKRVHALIAKERPELQPQLFCMSEHRKFKLESFDYGVFCLSSTGEGEPPENARAFWRQLARKNHPPHLLAGLRFAILGLGDSNFETYQQMPQRLEERLVELGAKSFYARGAADDATGLEDVVEPWIGGLMPALASALEPSGEGLSLPSSLSAEEEEKKEKVASATTPQPAGDGVTQAMNDLSLHKTDSAEESSTSAQEKEKKKIVIRRAPQKEIPDLVPCSFLLRWEVEPSHVNDYSPVIPASTPAASPLVHAKLVGARYLSSMDAIKPVIEVELRIPESGLVWMPGDAFGVLCPNPTSEVSQIIDRLSLDGNRVFYLEPKSPSIPLPHHVRFPCTVRTAFTYFVDLHAAPKKSSLRSFAEYASDPKDKDRLLLLSSQKGSDEYRKEVLEEGASFVDLLVDYPSLNPPLEEVLDKLPLQQPRYYSHVTSPLASTTTIKFAFSLVRWKSPNKGRKRRGLCTDWLYRLSVNQGYISPLDDDKNDEENSNIERATEITHKDEYVPLFARPTRDFVVPDTAANVIMVGAGTGVSPFLGFIQHKELLDEKAQNSKGTWWLFFGCRNEEKDFLYKDYLEGSVERGILDKLSAAFSRDSEEVVYVQHKMIEQGADIAEQLLSSNASIYVCGDGAGVVKGVNAAVIEVLERYGKLDPATAKQQHMSLLKDRRLLFDVW